ncbi:MAG: hypothetical protein V3S68_02410 [Dehalococcoidia bacterium]
MATQTGCAPEDAEASAWREAVAVQVAAVAMTTNTPAPSPTPDAGTKCSTCNGTGRVKTGDGISTTECDECGGDGVKDYAADIPDDIEEACEDCETGECVDPVGVVAPEPDELIGSVPPRQVYILPSVLQASRRDGPPIKVRAPDGNWREISTPGQAVAVGPTIFQTVAAPGDAVGGSGIPDEADIYPAPEVVIVVDTPEVCVDGSCATGAVVYSAPVCSVCGQVHATTTSARSNTYGDGPVRRFARGDGPIRRALRGEGPIRKAFRNRRGLFRRFRGC